LLNIGIVTISLNLCDLRELFTYVARTLLSSSCAVLDTRLGHASDTRILHIFKNFSLVGMSCPYWYGRVRAT